MTRSFEPVVHQQHVFRLRLTWLMSEAHALLAFVESLAELEQPLSSLTLLCWRLYFPRPSSLPYSSPLLEPLIDNKVTN